MKSVLFITNKFNYSKLKDKSSIRRVGKFLACSSLVIVWMVLNILFAYLPRPKHIFLKLLLRFDMYLFDITYSWIGPVTCLFCLLSGSWLLYFKFYSKVYHHNNRITKYGPLDNQGLPYFNNEMLNTERVIGYLNESNCYRPYNCWNLAPPILLACSWFILNTLFSLKFPINKAKNIIAWIFYVILHFLVPIGTGIWLHLFQAPGALKLYSLSVGLQNILIVLTHLIFPNAPPLYVRLYGENKQPTYDMIYTDGITRQDMKFGSRIYKSVYYATPNKFATMPSIHSSMAALTFFFVSYYSRWTSFKILAIFYLFVQWWSSLYLDHHWRFDLLMGLVYSIFVFSFIKKWKNGLNKTDETFIKSRLRLDFKNGSTAGMRIFKNSMFQNFFDPLS